MKKRSKSLLKIPNQKPKQNSLTFKIYSMKKQILSALMISIVLVSCTKSASKTEKVENPDGTITTTTTTESQTGLGVDTAKINQAKENTQTKIDEAGDKIDNAAENAKNKINTTADKAKEDLNKAGKDIKTGAQEVGKDVKNAAAKGASKVEEGAKKLKEDLSK